MTLPTKPQTRAGMPPRRARVLLGASAKVGKTTLLANWAPNTTLLVDTHHGTLLLDGEHYVSHVNDWASFVGVIDDVCRGGHRFHTIGLDLAGDLWRFCDLHFGRSKDGLRVPASGMDDYGRSSTKARSAFMTQLGRLLAAPVGIWFLTHLREKTNKEGELVVYAPDMDKAVHGYIMGAVDFVWLAEVDNRGRRVVHTQPTPHFEAGSRKQLPSPLPMDAGEIARALDRALSPQDYDADGKRKQPEPAPEVVPATEAPEPSQAALERTEPERTGVSDVPTPDLWWDATEQRMQALGWKGSDIRKALQEIDAPVPEHVGKWANVVTALNPSKRQQLDVLLLEREQVGTPLAPEPDAEPVA